MDSFYITLPSNVASFENNRIGNYRTLLPKRLELNNDWEVGVKEISYTKSWYNIPVTQKIKFVKIKWDSEKTSGIVIGQYSYSETHLSKGNYEEDELIYLVNNIFDNDATYTGERKCSMILDKNSKYVSMIAGKGKDNTYTLPIFDPIIAGILGFPKLIDQRAVVSYFVTTAKPGVDFYYSERPIDPTYGIRSLFLYTDIISGNIVGDTYAKLLRVAEIPIKSKFGDQVVLKYDNPQFHQLSKNNFDEILIDIKDDSGETIKFNYGRVILTFQFRKYK